MVTDTMMSHCEHVKGNDLEASGWRDCEGLTGASHRRLPQTRGESVKRFLKQKAGGTGTGVPFTVHFVRPPASDLKSPKYLHLQYGNGRPHKSGGSRHGARAEGLEPPTNGFGDHYSAIELRPYEWDARLAFLSNLLLARPRLPGAGGGTRTHTPFSERF